jgi:hypothetical protein
VIELAVGIDALATVELLIIDDFASSPMTREESPDIYQLFVERTGRASTIVTSRKALLPFVEPLYANAAPLCEADERIAEESRGHHEFAPTPEPSPRTLDARGERPSLRVWSVQK